MAITTLDGALAGMQPPRPLIKAITPTLVAGRPQSLWYLGGSPGVGLTPSTTTSGGVALSSSSALVAGQIPHYDPPGGSNSYLARFTGTATQAGLLLLCDRLLHCDYTTTSSGAISVTTTTAQTINTTTLPARDSNGATAGVGVLAALEIAAAVGSGTATPSISYTGTVNGSGQTGSMVFTYVASSALGAFYPFTLAAGDTGVASIQTLTLGVSMSSGNVALVLYRILAALELPGPLVPNAIDALTSGMPQLFNGTVPFLVFIPNTTTASYITGTYTETQG